MFVDDQQDQPPGATRACGWCVCGGGGGGSWAGGWGGMGAARFLVWPKRFGGPGLRASARNVSSFSALRTRHSDREVSLSYYCTPSYGQRLSNSRSFSSRRCFVFTSSVSRPACSSEMWGVGEGVQAAPPRAASLHPSISSPTVHLPIRMTLHPSMSYSMSLKSRKIQQLIAWPEVYFISSRRSAPSGTGPVF